MPQITTGYDPYSGVLSATQQGDALSGAERFGGGGGGFDAGGLVGAILGERRRKEQEARQDQLMREQRAAQQAAAMQQMQIAEARRQEEMALKREREARAYSEGAAGRRMRDMTAYEDYYRRRQTPAQMYAETMGGMGGIGYGESMRKIAAAQSAGLPPIQYSGWTDLYKAAAAAPMNAAAVEQANKNLRHQQSLASGGKGIGD